MEIERDRTQPAPLPEVCFTCGEPLRNHPRCRLCTILVGPGHVETTLVDGLCVSCAGFQERRPKRAR